MTMAQARKYPIGIQTFSEIRERNYLYIDKTQYLVDFIDKGYKYVFLSRPRRFGKSLFASMIHAYYEGRKDLFEGLAMGEYEKDWVKHPVLHFDMSAAKHMDTKQLDDYLDYLLLPYEKQFGTEENKDKAPNIRFANIVKAAYEQTGRKVVLIIDEYDAPLLDVVHEEEQLPELRNVMRNFYSPLKDCDPYLRFVLITGITKFSQLSIFSELNNIKDISMDSAYDGICGITSNELTTQLIDDVSKLASSQAQTAERTIANLKDYYDGYHFSWPSADIYNPYSLLNCFTDRTFDTYWFSSGTPTYLIEMMRKFDVQPSDIGNGVDAIRSGFDAPTETMDSLTPLLYQSGYLTIKSYNTDDKVYHLEIPNKEIRSSLYQSLLPYYFGKDTQNGNTQIAKMSALINKGNMDGALRLLRDFLSTVPYCDNTAYEGHYQQMLYVIFTILTNYRMQVEVRTHKGRIDVALETESRIYVMEIKFNGSADDALRQIDLKGYADAYKNSLKQIVKVGINFCVKGDANFTDWIIKQ